MSYIGFDISSFYKNLLDLDPRKSPSYPDIPTIYSEAQGKPILGNPIIFPITFAGGSYRRLKNGKDEIVSLEDYDLPPTSICQIGRSKNMGVTPVGGGKATVKEVFSFEDYEIKITGLFLKNGNMDIDKEISLLLEFENLTDSIKVYGHYFELLGINNIVIRKIDIQQVAGRPGSVPFVLDCISDDPIELIL